MRPLARALLAPAARREALRAFSGWPAASPGLQRRADPTVAAAGARGLATTGDAAAAVARPGAASADAPPCACCGARTVREDALHREVAALRRELADAALDSARALAAARRELVDEALDSARVLAAAKRETDRAAGVCGARGLLEACAEEAWSMCLHVRRMGDGRDRLAALLDEQSGCAGLRALFRVAAVDNNADPAGVLAAARGLFATVGAHARAREGGCIPPEVFDDDRHAHLAFAILVHFSGRNMHHYEDVEDSHPWLVVRARRRCGGARGGGRTEAEAHFRAAPRLTYSRI